MCVFLFMNLCTWWCDCSQGLNVPNHGKLTKRMIQLKPRIYRSNCSRRNFTMLEAVIDRCDRWTLACRAVLIQTACMQRHDHAAAGNLQFEGRLCVEVSQNNDNKRMRDRIAYLVCFCASGHQVFRAGSSHVCRIWHERSTLLCSPGLRLKGQPKFNAQPTLKNHSLPIETLFPLTGNLKADMCQWDATASAAQGQDVSSRLPYHGT